MIIILIPSATLHGYPVYGAHVICNQVEEKNNNNNLCVIIYIYGLHTELPKYSNANKKLEVVIIMTDLCCSIIIFSVFTGIFLKAREMMITILFEQSNIRKKGKQI